MDVPHLTDKGCPRCGGRCGGGTAARLLCARCGHDWQADPPAARGLDEHPDDLGAAAAPLARIRRFLDGPER